MSFLDNLVDSRRQRLEKLGSENSKTDESLSLPVESDNNNILTKNISLEDSSTNLQNSNDNSGNNEEEDKEEKEDELNDQSVSVTKDFEMKLNPQLRELETRTNLALKRILRKRMVQNDLNEESIDEYNDT